jgi:hypothetical protein
MWQPTALAPEGPARPREALTASPGELGSKINSGSSAAHHVQSTLVLLPTGTIDRGTRKHYLVGEVQRAYAPILAQAGRNGNGLGDTG